MQEWYNEKQSGHLSQRWKCKWYLEEAAAGPYGWQLIGDKYYKVLSSIGVFGTFLDELPHTVYPAYELEFEHRYGSGSGGCCRDFLRPILEHTITCARYYLPREKLNMTFLTPEIQQWATVKREPVWNMLVYKNHQRIPSEWYTQEIAITRTILQQQMNEVLPLMRLMRTQDTNYMHRSGEKFVSNFAVALKNERAKTIDPLKIRFYAQIWDFLFNSKIIEELEFLPFPIQNYTRQFGAPLNLEDLAHIAL